MFVKQIQMEKKTSLILHVYISVKYYIRVKRKENIFNNFSHLPALGQLDLCFLYFDLA